MKLGNYQVKWSRNLDLGHTYVEIYTKEDLITPVVTGVSVKSESDKYNKNKGRQVALTRALKTLKDVIYTDGGDPVPVPFFSKAERAEIWADYLETLEEFYEEVPEEITNSLNAQLKTIGDLQRQRDNLINVVNKDIEMKELLNNSEKLQKDYHEISETLKNNMLKASEEREKSLRFLTQTKNN